jgi:NAD(P)-dependent dehydrogenase (short-subunit alcohol dehydrogenase family)
VLVNNAGEVLRQPLVDISETDFHRHLMVNVTSLFSLTQALVPSLARNGAGSVINFGSVHGPVTGRNMSAYATGKAALIGLTKAMAVELAPDIRVNMVQPGIFKTEINDALIGDPVAAEAVRRRIPAGRFGEPDDLADVVCFLAGNASRYITGVTLPVDAGLTARIGLPSGDAAG